MIGLKINAYNGQAVAFGVDYTYSTQGRYHFAHKLVGEAWSWGFDPGASVMMDLYTSEAQLDHDQGLNIGVNQVKASNNVKVYPNPTTGLVNLENVENATINVYSLAGNLVKTVQSTSVNASINLTGLAKGTYLVKVVKANEVVTKKISLLK